ncbi:AAA family ATPase [Streptomyces sp. NPDC049687]|uniref:helix-turn-helix transcriptional regulator n=1 Tax=Streptomyces sp. NPDC049687 TaxID=3365596 RepID=UPI0037A00DB2
MRLFIERDVQLAQLCPLIDQKPAQGPHLGVITGPVACGKTELLEEVVQRATDDGIRVLSAQCSSMEQSIPYAMVDQLFRGLALAGELPLMPDEIRAARGAPVPAPPLLRFFHEVMVSLSARGSLLLTVDDIHHADEQSLRVLLYLHRRARYAPASLLVSHGAQYGIPVTAPLRELLHQPRVRRVTVGPLSKNGTARLTHSLAEPGNAPRAAEVFALTGGNPLLLHALLQDRAAAGPRAEGDGTPLAGDAYVHAALTCIHRSGPDGLRITRALAVLDGHGSVDALARLAGLELATVERTVRVLTDAGLLTGRHFRQTAVRDAVLDDLPPEERADLHQQAAALLYSEGAPALDIADHLLTAGQPGEPWATRVLTEAGRQAQRIDRTQLALRCLRHAEKTAAEEAERLCIGAELAATVWRTRPGVAAQQLRTLAGPAGEGRLPAGHTLSVVPGLLWHGMADEAVAALRAAEDAARTDPAVAGGLDTLRMWIDSTYPAIARRTGHEPAPLPVRASPAQAATDPTAAAAGRALWALSSVLRGHNHQEVSDTAEQVLQSVRLHDHTLEVLTAAVSALIYGGRLTVAAEWGRRLEAEAAERQAPTWRAVLGSLRAVVALRLGDLPTAARLAQTSLELMPAEAWGVGVGIPLSTAINAALSMGDSETAAQLVARPVPEHMLDTRFGLHYLSARARHHMMEGRTHAALADHLSCGERMREWGMDTAELVPWRVNAAKIWLRTDNAERAAQLIEEHLAVAESGRPGTRGVALRILAATKDPVRRVELLGQAVELLQAGGNRYELAWGLADLGHLHHQLGEPAKARTFARRAWRVAKDCGAEALYQSLFPGQAARQERGGQDKADAIGSLTEAELRVAALATQGHTNREIGAKLFITVSTVEQHLTRVYRKLDVRHRQDLPTSLLLQESDLTAV